MPSVSLRNVRELESQDLKVYLKNVIGFGKTCEEYSVKIDGSSVVSYEQKEIARRSIATRKCEEVTRKVEELRQSLKTITKETPEFTRIEQELLRLTEEKIEFCRQQLTELTTLDSVKLNIEYSNMPEYVKEYSKVLDIAVKTVLLPYMTEVESRRSNNEIVVALKFLPHLNAFNMVLTTEEGTVKYHTIRLPTIVKGVIPIVAAEQPIVELVSRIRGTSLYPECRVGDSVVKTFANSTYSYELDGCYHVLVADSSRQSYFAVLAKELEGKKEVKVFVHETEVVLKPTRSYSKHNKEYEILVDGEKIEIRPEERKEIPVKSSKVILKVIRSPDNVIILETPYLRVIYDGELVEIKETGVLIGRDIKGLCGVNKGDQRFDVLTSSSKVAPTYKAAAISHRYEKSCPSLTPEQQVYKQQLRQAKHPIVQKSPVTKFLKSKLEKCSQMMHSTIWKGPSFCISQTPVLQCGTGCSPRSMVTKPVPFTCLPASRERVIRLYEEKVRRGDILPELRNMEKSFTTKMYVPVTCTHPGL